MRTIGSYRTVHAHATKTWFKQAVHRYLPDIEGSFLTTPMSDDAMRIVRLVWFVKEMPLATKHYFVDLHKKFQRHPELLLAKDPRLMAFNMAADAVSK